MTKKKLSMSTFISAGVRWVMHSSECARSLHGA